MKKIIIFIGIVLVLFSSVTVFAENCNIECTTEITGQSVCISGRITNVTGSHSLILLVGDPDNILYIDQVKTADDGTFVFDFSLPDTLDSGSYAFKIGSNSEAEPYSGILEYKKSLGEIEQQFFDGNIIVSVSNYIPTIAGNVSCIDGKEITFNVVNSSDNIVIAQDIVTSEDGIHSLYYVLPSLITGKDYAVTISCEGETKNLFSIDVDINSSIILVEISGTVQVARNVRLETNVQSTNSNLIDKSSTITSNTSISSTIPNLVSNMSCYVTLRGYETVVIYDEPLPDPDPEPDPDPDPEPDPEPDPDPLPDADEIFQTIETEYSVEGNVDELKRVLINISDVPMLHEKVFTINYNTAQLELVDVCSFTNKKELTPGLVAGTYIEILSVTSGQVKFKINKTFSGNVVTSGVINAMTFKKLSTGETEITSKIEKAQQ